MQLPRLRLLDWFIKAANPQSPPGDVARLLCKWDCELIQNVANGSIFWGANFPPIWPYLIRGAMKALPFIDGFQVQLLLSNLFAILALLAVYGLADALWPTQTREPKGKTPVLNSQALLLCLGLSLFPYGMYFSLGYSEPLFLLLYAGTLWALFKERWLIAGLLCGLTPLTRPQGMWMPPFMAAALFLPLLTQKRKAWPRDLGLRAAGSALALVGLAGLLLWCWIRFGNPLQTVSGQKAWGRTFDILPGIERHLPKFDNSRILLWLALIAAWTQWKRREAHWRFVALCTVAMVEVPVFFGGFISFPRYMATNLGIFFLLTEVSHKRLWVLLGLVTLALTLLAIETYRWAFVPIFYF